MSGSVSQEQRDLAAASGREVNNAGRLFKRGAAYSEDVKLEIAAAYQEEERASGGARPNLSELARRFKVDKNTVSKIEGELLTHGRVLPPSEIRASADRPVGPGALSLSTVDQYVILRLYFEEPSRTLKSYKDNLAFLTGTEVSIDTVSRVLLDGFPYKGSLVKPNLVPLDKFKPQNVVRAFEFLQILFTLQPTKIIFADEKHVKGEELFSRKVRKCLLTGTTPAIMTDSNFRNTHTIIGFCSIDESRVLPTWFRITKGTNGAAEFRDTCENAVQDGFLRPWDVLVVDNATVHNEVETMLWDTCRVMVLFLPPRAPEWNPKELVWQTMLQRMGSYPLSALKELYGDRDIVATAAARSLSQTTFSEVRSYYSKCFSFFHHWKALSTAE